MSDGCCLRRPHGRPLPVDRVVDPAMALLDANRAPLVLQGCMGAAACALGQHPAQGLCRPLCSSPTSLIRRSGGSSLAVSRGRITCLQLAMAGGTQLEQTLADVDRCGPLARKPLTHRYSLISSAYFSLWSAWGCRMRSFRAWQAHATTDHRMQGRARLYKISSFSAFSMIARVGRFSALASLGEKPRGELRLWSRL